jgi:hypothetical protein
MTRSGFIAAALAVATATTLLSGCGKKSSGGAPAGGPAGSQPPASHVSGTPHTDDVVDAWRSAGLRPEGFAPLQPVPYGAAFCEEGRVQGVDTLVCEYADDGTLGRGQQLLKDEWGREGVHTGVTLTSKRTMVAIVDRGRHDPNGKTINQLVKAFRKL